MLLAEAQTAGLARLDSAEGLLADVDPRVVERLRINARFVSESVENPPDEGSEPLTKAYGRLRRAMIEAEREAVLAARAEGRYQERAITRVLAKIDVEETELDLAKPRDDG